MNELETLLLKLREITKRELELAEESITTAAFSTERIEHLSKSIVLGEVTLIVCDMLADRVGAK